MPVAVGFAKPDVFAVRATGDVTYDECQRAIDEILYHRAADTARKILVDARGTVTAPKTHELQAIARDMRLLIARGYGPMAIVTDRTFVYGVARMFAVFAEAFGLRVRAFKTVDEASAWLKNAPAAETETGAA